MSSFQVNIVLLPDAPQLLKLFVRTLTYLEPKLFLLIIFLMVLLNYYNISCVQYVYTSMYTVS
jgi:hypothetical protein